MYELFDWSDDRRLSSDEQDVYDFYRASSRLSQLMRRLSESQITIIILSFGLIDGVNHHPRKVAQMIGLDVTTIRASTSRAFSKMQETERDRQLRIQTEKNGQTFIEDLGLRDKAYRELLQVKLYSVECLVMMTEKQLLRMRGIGGGVINDIKACLSACGLKLAIDPGTTN